jgi:small-conductance mechanosensitive channel
MFSHPVIAAGPVSTVSSVLWHRALTVAVVIAVALVVAKVADRAMARRQFDPASATRYRVLRRSIVSSIVAIGILSALLVIPAVRAVAGGILASGAVLGIVVGFAAQSTLSNFVAGVMIAFTQPLRLGDSLLTSDGHGIVEEIGLVYTLIRLEDGSRLVVPNSKLASDTIRNASIVSHDRVAEITVQLPLATDLQQALARLRSALPADRNPDVFVSALTDRATITVRARADDAQRAEELARDLRLWAHEALRAEGAFA